MTAKEKRKIIKYYRNEIEKNIKERNCNWTQIYEPVIEKDEKLIYLSDIVCELRTLGVDIKMPNIWTEQHNVWLEIGSEIIRQIDEYLNWIKHLFTKYIPLYVPIIISIISIVISCSNVD